MASFKKEEGSTSPAPVFISLVRKPMDRQQSNPRIHPRHRDSVLPLYFATEALTTDLVADIEQVIHPPAYSIAAQENHINADSGPYPAESSKAKTKERYPTSQYSPVFDSGSSRDKANRIFYPTPQYAPVFDEDTSANLDVHSRPGVTLSGTKAGTSFPTPRYSIVFDDEAVDEPLIQPEDKTELVMHEYQLKSGLGKSSTVWATLRLFSQAASQQKVPRFHGGQISGFIDVMGEGSGAPSVHAITLILRGKIIYILQGNYSSQHIFLDEQFEIWAKSSSPGLSPGCAKNLEGSHSWPFSIPFPAEIELSLPGGKQMYPTPQTFLERGKNISVQYELIFKVSHGFLRADSKLPIVISYIPDKRPPPMSESRQTAYQNGIPLPGPEVDTTGWYTLPPVSITGQLLQRAVRISCVLSLAKPLIYTRGTVIPVHIKLRSNDSQALDILSSAKAVQVRLMQTIEYFQDPKNLAGPIKDTQLITLAQWWIPSDQLSAQESGKRVMHGELHLPKEIQPSCGFLLMNVEYTVELVPFVSPVFECAQHPNHHLISCPVTIGTVNAFGPVPKAVTSPPPREVLDSIPHHNPLESSGSFMRLDF